MAAPKKAPAKKAPAKKAGAAPAGGQSVSRRVAELEKQVATLSAQIENLARIFSTMVAGQLQQQLLASPNPEAHMNAFASANGIKLD